jgi:hypothetical protein
MRRCACRMSLQRLRCSALVQPFAQGKTGHDIESYGFAAAASPLFSNPHTVGVSVNGFEGLGVKFVEDFFVVVTSGFDIVAVTEELPYVDDVEERLKGTFALRHVRPFLGWKSTGMDLCAPFSLCLKLCNGDVERMNLACDLAGSLRVSGAGCPHEVLKCLEQPAAMHMLVALRRAKVKPDFISHRALLSGTKKEETWCNALGLL